MTIEECYRTFGGDYEGVCTRLLSSDRVAKFAIRFLDVKDYENLVKAMDRKDWEEAFICVHTLKGLGLNLGFTKFAEYAANLTEELRGGLKSEVKAVEYFNLMAVEYKKVVDGLSQYSQ